VSEPATVPELEAVFIRDVAATPGIRNALDHEPQKLPTFPCVTMLYTGPEPFDAETGAGEDVTHTWIVRLYVPFKNIQAAQTHLKTLLPALAHVVRANPRLDDQVDFAVISNDNGSEPFFDEAAGFVVKQMRLTARLTLY
jgi:hypothetical protein